MFVEITTHFSYGHDILEASIYYTISITNSIITICFDMYHICKVGYFGQALVDDELEGDPCENEGESQLESVLGLGRVHGERHERQAAYQQLEQGKQKLCEVMAIVKMSVTVLCDFQSKKLCIRSILWQFRFHLKY